jgi:glutaredoxin 3
MNMKKLELFYFKECPYCQTVLNEIDKLKLKKTIHFLNTRENISFKERLLKVTGKTQVPCLFIDDKPMFESADIVIWLRENSQHLKA